MSLSYGVLGPLEVLRDGEPVGISAPKQRVLLASLLVEAPQQVTVDRLVERLWGDRPGRNARSTLHVHLTRLRDTLGDAGAIATTDDGYRIDAGPGTLDLADFEALVRRAERAEADGDRATAATLLHRALGLWRGQALSNVPSEGLRRDVVPALDERRLQVTEHRVGLDIQLGRADGVITELHQLTAEHWLREHLWALLMRALYLAGRQGEALQTYRRVSALLADELGVDPGAELRETHQGVLTGDLAAPEQERAGDPPPPVAPPHQLPARPAGFVGRKAALDDLLTLFSGEGGCTAVLSGPPGVGKSALATCAAHLLSERFPDGELFADLRGFSAAPAPRTGDVLARFVRALGMPPDRIPADLDELGAAYRSWLSGKRVLVVLDNAPAAESVRPLLPGEQHCGVLVTSRNQLRGLVALDGARPVALDVLSPDDAVDVLRDQVGADRLAAEPEAAVVLAGLCSYLPLALRIVGANLASRPYDTIVDYVEELGGDRLTGMWAGADDEARVTAAFELSYDALEPGAKELFRLLGLIPGPDFTKAAVAALAGSRDAARQLDALVSASLVQPHAPGRYHMHDLTRSFAQHLDAGHTGTPADDARGRLFDWYLRMTDAALSPRYPNRVRMPREAPADGMLAKASVAWVEDELANLLATVTHAAAGGPVEYSWHLVDALRAYLQASARYTEWDTVSRLAADAAGRAGDLDARATMHLHRGALAYLRSQDEESITESKRAVQLYADLGDRLREAAAWHNVAVSHEGAKRWDEAVHGLEQALAIFRAENHPHAAHAAFNLSVCQLDLGRLREATEGLEESRALSRSHQNPETEGMALIRLGEAARRRGDLVAAVGHLEQAVRLVQELGDVMLLVEAHTELVRTHCDAAAYETARSTAAAARDTARTLSDEPVAVDLDVASAEADVRAGEPDTWAERLPALLVRQEAAGDEERVAACRAVVAWMYQELGDTGRALDAANRALEFARTNVLRLDEDEALTTLTAVLVSAGRLDEAVQTGAEALARHEETGSAVRAARTLCHLGDARFGLGERDQARRCWQQARDRYAGTGTGEVVEAKRRLSEL